MALGAGIASMGGGVKVGSAFGLVSIRSDTSGIKSITKALGTLNPLTAAAGIGLGVLKTGLTGVGVGMGLATAAAVSGTKKFANFEYVMAGVKAKAEEVGISYDQLSGRARELGRETVFTAMEVAEGMEFLAMTGFDTSEIFEVMPGLIDVAAASMTDLGRTSDIVSNILRGFNIDTSEMTRVGDVLVNTLVGSNVRLEDLGTTMSYLGPQAEAMGFSLEEMAAAAGLLGDAGIPASTAGTALRGALVRMAAPTDKAAGMMEKYNVDLTDGEGNMKSFIGIIGELQKELSGLSVTEQTAALKEIVGLRAITSFQSLMRQFESGKLESFTAAMYETGTAAEIADEMLDNLKGDTILLQSVWDSFLMDIGERFEPVMRDLVQMLSTFITDEGDDFVDWFGKVADKITELLPLFKRWLPIIKDWVLWSGTNLVNAFSWLVTKGTELYDMFNLELFKSDVGNYGWMGAIMGALQRLGVDTSIIQQLWGWYDWATSMASTSWEWIKNVVEWLESLYTVGMNMYEAWGGIEGIFNLIKAYMSSGAMFDDSMDLADMFWGWILTAHEMAAEKLNELSVAFRNWANQPDTQANAAEIGQMIAGWILEYMGYEFDDEGNMTGLGDSILGNFGSAVLNIIGGIAALGVTVVASFFEGILNTLTDGKYEAMTIAELKALSARIDEIGAEMGTLSLGAALAGYFGTQTLDLGDGLMESLSMWLSESFWGALAWLDGTDEAQQMAQKLSDIMGKILMLAWDVIALGPLSVWGALFGDGIEAQIYNLLNENDEIIQMMVDLGGKLIAGLTEGILGAGVSVKDTLRSVLDFGIFGAQEDQDINSPSGVTATEIGEPMGMGIAQGLTNSMAAIQDAMNMSSMVAATAGAGASNNTTNNAKSLVIEGPLVSVSGGGDVEKIREAVEGVLDRIFQNSDSSDTYQ